MSKLGIKRATSAVDLVTDLELLSEHERASDTLAKLQRDTRSDDRLNSSAEVKKAAKAIRALEEKMSDSTVVVKLRALKRSRWAELEEKHPQREDNEVDKRFGVNVDTFFDEAIPECVIEVTDKKSGKKVEFDPATEWAPLADEMSDGQYAEFIGATLALNRGATSVPFSRVASAVTQG